MSRTPEETSPPPIPLPGESGGGLTGDDILCLVALLDDALDAARCGADLCEANLQEIRGKLLRAACAPGVTSFGADPEEDGGSAVYDPPYCGGCGAALACPLCQGAEPEVNG